MNIIGAIKLPRDSRTGKPCKTAKWTLVKILDSHRAQPTAQIFHKMTKEGEVNGYRDKNTGWMEGIYCDLNGKGNVGLVNSTFVKAEKNAESRQFFEGEHILEAICTSDIDEAVLMVKKNQLMGHTFITDGKKLLCLEVFNPPFTSEDKQTMIDNSTRGTQHAKFSTGEIFRSKQVVINCTELDDRDSPFHVRINPIFSGADAPVVDESCKISSARRMEYTQSYLHSVFNKYQLIRWLGYLGHPRIDPNPSLRPIIHHNNALPIFTSMGIVMDVTNNQMHILPVSNSITITKNSERCNRLAVLWDKTMAFWERKSREQVEKVIVHPEITQKVLYDPLPVVQLQRCFKALLWSFLCYFFLFLTFSESIEKKIVNFWMNECAPFDGLMRITVYSSLFIVFHRDRNSPLRFGNQLYKIDKRLIGHAGLLLFLPKHYLSPDNISRLATIAYYSWICCIVGFGGIFPPFMLVICILTLQGAKQCTEVCFSPFYLVN